MILTYLHLLYYIRQFNKNLIHIISCLKNISNFEMGIFKINSVNFELQTGKISLISAILHLWVWFRSHKKSTTSLKCLIYDLFHWDLVTLKHKTNPFIIFSCSLITLAIKKGDMEKRGGGHVY